MGKILLQSLGTGLLYIAGAVIFSLIAAFPCMWVWNAVADKGALITYGPTFRLIVFCVFIGVAIKGIGRLLVGPKRT